MDSLRRQNNWKKIKRKNKNFLRYTKELCDFQVYYAIFQSLMKENRICHGIVFVSDPLFPCSLRIIFIQTVKKCYIFVLNGGIELFIGFRISNISPNKHSD